MSSAEPSIGVFVRHALVGHTSQIDPTIDTTRKSLAARAVSILKLVAVSAATTGCLGEGSTGPVCRTEIGIELSVQQVFVGDSFTATATHSGEECLRSLSWSASGPVVLQAAEDVSATFGAEAEGNATITVRSTLGGLGTRTVEIEQRETTRTSPAIQPR